MDKRMGAPVRTLGDDEAKRLKELRAAASERRAAVQSERPDDPLGAVAWLAGALDPLNTKPHPELLAQVARAREARFTWREIAEALGESDDPEVARRIRDRFNAWAST